MSSDYLLEIARQLDGDDPEAMQAAYDRAADESMQRFMLKHRHEIGRALNQREYLLARLAHAHGFLDGIDLGLEIADLAPSDDADAATARPSDGQGEG